MICEGSVKEEMVDNAKLALFWPGCTAGSVCTNYRSSSGLAGRAASSFLRPKDLIPPTAFDPIQDNC